jgi:PII-like signaling protein
MQGVYLKLFVPEAKRHHGKLLYEWILEEAHRLGIPGGSAFRAIAGYGRHGRLHEQAFFELAGDQPVQVEFAAPREAAQLLLERLHVESLSVFYLMLPAEYGATDDLIPTRLVV